MNYQKKLQPDLWLSLHDITPSVTARRQVVYCHNASPFYKISLKEALFDPKFLLFNWFYIYLYKINIQRNYAVIVQQHWLRLQFKKIFNHNNIIVAHPVQQEINIELTYNTSSRVYESNKIIFIYPTLPRVFKNIEILFQAAQLLSSPIQDAIEIRITINGTENKYSQQLFDEFKHLKCINFIGRQDRKSMAEHYEQANTVLFPSKLESWGLPISEAKFFKKSILVADLPYAHEATGIYDLVSFINPNNANDWALAITQIVQKEIVYTGANSPSPEKPYASNWHNLWQQLSNGL